MKSILRKTGLASVIMFCGATFNANAAEIGVDIYNDLGAVTPGEVCTLAEPGDYYTYTASTTGAITVQTDYTGEITALLYPENYFSYFMFYQYDDIYLQLNAASYEMVEGEGWKVIFNVEGGKNYLFGYSEDMLHMPLKFTLSDGNENVVDATMTYCFPIPGTTFDEGLGINDIVMEFDQSLLSVAKVYLSFTNKEGVETEIPVMSSDTIGYNIENKILVVRIANTNTIYAQAKSQADYSKPLYLKMDKLMGGTGPVTSAKLIDGGNEYVTCDSEGNVAVEYKFMDGVVLTSAEWPEPFNSYWAPGEKAGMATLTFDGPVNLKKSNMRLIMGHVVRGSSSGEEPDFNWPINASLNEDRTVLTLNFTGINYGKSLDKNFDEVTIMISGIYGDNGMVAILQNGKGYLDKYIQFVNEPYGDVQAPEVIPGEPVASVENEAEINSFENIVISWETPVTFVEGMDPVGTVSYDTGAPVSVPLSIDENGDLVVEISELQTPELPFIGTFVINIPEGIVADADGNVNDPVSLVYLAIVDDAGIEGIIDDAQIVKGVFNLKGVKVSDSTENLPAGIYIVNGKKVLVK